jgi:hypothetical protein
MITEPAPNRVFLLSPASCSGRRAAILLRNEAKFDLANRLRSSEGVTLGEVFSFLSGLYFRGNWHMPLTLDVQQTDLRKLW